MRRIVTFAVSLFLATSAIAYNRLPPTSLHIYNQLPNHDVEITRIKKSKVKIPFTEEEIAAHKKLSKRKQRRIRAKYHTVSTPVIWESVTAGDSLTLHQRAGELRDCLKRRGGGCFLKFTVAGIGQCKGTNEDGDAIDILRVLRNHGDVSVTLCPSKQGNGCLLHFFASEHRLYC